MANVMETESFRGLLFSSAKNPSNGITRVVGGSAKAKREKKTQLPIVMPKTANELSSQKNPKVEERNLLKIFFSLLTFRILLRDFLDYSCFFF